MREPTNQEILDILAEECNEVGHIVSKIRRFGMDSVHPKGNGITNKAHLRFEILDVISMIRWAEQAQVLPPILTDEVLLHTKNKQQKVRRYLRE